MADTISDRVLKRRQKDVSDFVVNYQQQLDRTAGRYAKELVPVWTKIHSAIEKRAKKYYAQAGLLSESGNTRKIRSAMREAERLGKLANGIARDLQQVEKMLQPYYSANLGHEFEKSYYMHLFGMEQAAQVAVQTPLLNPAQILGVLANPWLGDGANYSDRIRANTAFLAQKMKSTMIEATSLGWGWNEAARKLEKVANEGYFNSVRLIRTEMNRAAALGASYSYMENADILDGKRWNATLDSKTAAKDAKNDGKLYDLDYDTPTNRGIPGQRIPNHPNCRCKWSPVLSSLGVSKKERIARAADDRPDQFGTRTYTKAGTYREYAKERGLPDLDKRLEIDSPKKYLRSGESLADLNLKVKRWSYKGKAITVPTPAWETAKEFMAGIPDSLQTAFDPDGNFNEEKYSNKISNFTDLDEYYDYVMKTSDHLVERELKDLDDDLLAKINIEVKKWDDGSEYYVIKYKNAFGGPVTKSFEDPNRIVLYRKFNSFDSLEDQKDWLDSKLKEWQKVPQDDWAAIKRTTQDRTTFQDIVKGAEREANKQRFEGWTWPTNDKLTARQRDKLTIKKSFSPTGKEKEIAEKIDDANDWIRTHVNGKNAPKQGINAGYLRRGSRAYAQDIKGDIFLAGDSPVETVVHEAAHCIHYQNPTTRDFVDAFFKKRTAGLTKKPIYTGTSEKGYKDNFFNHYVGKVYSTDGWGGREVVSMGMGEMYQDPAGFYAKDPNHFKLIYAIMRGLQLK